MAIFVDTNVLLYAVSTAPAEAAKGAAALVAGVTVRNPFAAVP